MTDLLARLRALSEQLRHANLSTDEDAPEEAAARIEAMAGEIEGLRAEQDEWTIERAVGQQQLDGLVTILHLIRQEAATIVVKPDATWISIPGLGCRRLNEWIDEQIEAVLTSRSVAKRSRKRAPR